jgi:flagella basal body P-ring formation protein FlgA
MRFSRSLDRIARVAVAVIAILSVAATGAADSTTADRERSEQLVREAIRRMVEMRLREPAEVSVELRDVTLRVTADEYVASAAPGARIGKPVRFTLRSADGVGAGYAVARVDVAVRHAIAVRELSRGETIAPDAFEWVTRAITGEPFERLPAEEELLGSVARRSIARSEALTFRNVMVPPAVKNGDRITAKVRVDEIEVTGEVVASGSGHVGDTIRVLTPGGEVRTARIVASKLVEIVR